MAKPVVRDSTEVWQSHKDLFSGLWTVINTHTHTSGDRQPFRKQKEVIIRKHVSGTSRKAEKN